MKQFAHPNMTNFICPVCRTNADRPVVLVPIPGTGDGRIVECRQVHGECYQVVMRMNGVEVELEPVDGE